MEVDSDHFTEDDDDDDGPHHLLASLPTGVLFEVFRHLDWKDLCSLSQTCRQFWELCRKATLWMQLTNLDFTDCAVPIADRILGILQRCPNTECLKISGMVLEDITFDVFLSSVFSKCQKLRNVTLDNPDITNRSLEILYTKGDNLESIQMNMNDVTVFSEYLTQIMAMNTLKTLHLQKCRTPVFIPRIGENPKYNIRHLILNDMSLEEENVKELLQSCIHLEVLNLREAVSMFPTDGLPSRNGLNQLRILDLGSNDLESLEISQVLPCLETLNIDMLPFLLSVKIAAPQLRHINCYHDLSLTTMQLSPCNISCLKLASVKNLEHIEVYSACLHEIKVKNSPRITCESLMAGISHKESVQILSFYYCEKISARDINEIILKQLPRLWKLAVSVDDTVTTWDNEEIKSRTLKSLDFKVNAVDHGPVVSCLALSMPDLTSLSMTMGRAVMESELLDGLLYGKKIERFRAVDGHMREFVEMTPFLNNCGVPSLQELYLHQMRQLKGNHLSSKLNHFKFLTKLVFVQCPFLSELFVNDHKSLEILLIESCPKFSSLHIQDSHRLNILHVKYCSMMQDCNVSADSLCEVDFNGTNIARLKLCSNQLTQLILYGVCTRESHSICLRCQKLNSLSIQKCDMLEEETLNSLFHHCPVLSSLSILASYRLRTLLLPCNLVSLSLTGLRRIQQIQIPNTSQIQHLTLNNLPKLIPSLRLDLLTQCESTLEELEVRAIPKETTLTLKLSRLKSLTLDQGIHLSSLCIHCPKLTHLRIQGCPKLSYLEIQIQRLSQLQTFQSSQLHALRCASIITPNIKHLSTILAYYTPNLESLMLQGCNILKGHVISLGKCIPTLSKIDLVNCNFQEEIPSVIEPEIIGRNMGETLSIFVS